MSTNLVIDLLIQAEAELQQVQNKNADRNRAVALTHIQTAILWMNKQYVDEIMKADEQK